MDLTALLLSRIQFAFTIAFHSIFPSFTIGLAAWLTILEALSFGTGRPVFEFWLKVFAVALGFGVVSGVVMGFQFETNWDVLARMSGPIQGVLLSYETFTAFFLEASFSGYFFLVALALHRGFTCFQGARCAEGRHRSIYRTPDQGRVPPIRRLEISLSQRGKWKTAISQYIRTIPFSGDAWVDIEPPHRAAIKKTDQQRHDCEGRRGREV
jgi:hypothetical protein